MSSKHYSTNIPNKKQRNKEMKNIFEKEKLSPKFPKENYKFQFCVKSPNR